MELGGRLAGRPTGATSERGRRALLAPESRLANLARPKSCTNSSSSSSSSAKPSSSLVFSAPLVALPVEVDRVWPLGRRSLAKME